MRTASRVALVVAAGLWAPRVASAAEPARDPARIAVATAGMFEVTPDEGPVLDLLHVRLILSNRGRAVPWRFDPPATRIDLGRDGVTRPVLVNADVATLPIVMVDPGARVTVDLFAVVPARMLARPDALDQLTIWTTIATPDQRRIVTARYDRPTPPFAWVVPAAATVGAGQSWWANPRYPWRSVQRSDGPIHGRAPSSATVQRRSTRRTRTARRCASAAPRRARSSSTVSGPGPRPALPAVASGV